jgi:hypothetical protein
MADIEFDPATEFQVLETFEFEEQIQRPETLRFYTLEEQLLDYVEKRMPLGKATRFQVQELQRERDRMQEAYLGIIDDDFELKPKRIQTMPSWVHPIHADFTYNSYDFDKQWTPVLEQRRVPNYYTRMILALPKPYITKDSERPPITETTKTVNGKGDETVALGQYTRSKTALHENGTIDILPLPIPNTQDDIRIKGYRLDKRPLDIPNPLAEHPFLSSAEASTITTDEPFVNVFPSINAVMTHGVPTTTDPYGQGQMYLKLYDVTFPAISWELWKRRFPPVDSIETAPPTMSVPFPKPDAKVPSENLRKVYTTFHEGIDPYTWLMNQEDAGAFVPRMLLSKTSEAGLLPVIPRGEFVEPSFSESTPEECLQTDTFDTFLNSGVYRKNTCIPVSYVQQERKDLVSYGRKAWRESTEMDLLKEYQIRLIKTSRIALPSVEPIYQKYEAKETPELRKEILAVSSDPRRLDVDKVRDLATLVDDILPQDRLYLTADKAFLLCEHTIQLLKRPEMEPFYREWTFIESGYRVCKFCGEQINRDVFSSQDDFDEAGHVILSRDTLPTSIHASETNVSEFTKSLGELKEVFELDKGRHIGRMLLYLLLSLFQVVPLESQLLPVLTFMDGVSAAFKSAKKGSDELDGAIGIVGAAVLLQTHNPFLIPRRSFGSKQMKLSGYPRDTDDSKQASVVNTILYVLQTTFESFPSTFAGPIGSFMRLLNVDAKKVRSLAISLLGKATQKFKAQYADAKERYLAVPEDVQVNQMKLPMRVTKQDVVKPDEFKFEETKSTCSVPRPLSYLQSTLPPSVVQKQLKLLETIPPAHRISVVAKDTKPVALHTIPTESVRDRIKKGFPKKLKTPGLAEFVENEQDGISLLSLLTRLLDTFQSDIPKNVLSVFRAVCLTLQTRISNELLRDTVRGIVYQVLHMIADSETMTKKLAVALKQDITLRMLMTDKTNALKEDQGLRAREREVLKSRLREKNDAEREILKLLLDIGIAPYIITNKDREQYAKESEDGVIVEAEEERPEGEYDVIQGQDEDRNIEDNETGMRYNREEDYGYVGTQIAEETD